MKRAGVFDIGQVARAWESDEAAAGDQRGEPLVLLVRTRLVVFAVEHERGHAQPWQFSGEIEIRERGHRAAIAFDRGRRDRVADLLPAKRDCGRETPGVSQRSMVASAIGSSDFAARAAAMRGAQISRAVPERGRRRFAQHQRRDRAPNRMASASPIIPPTESPT